jgi:hypothetical protein
MKKQINDLFFDTFAGAWVEILQDYEVTTSVNMTSKGEAQQLRMPMTITGCVMETDGEFLFLSTDGQEVNQALPIHSIKHIGIINPIDPVQEILDNIDVPDGQGFN